ncbi:MAG: 7-carboxy-7-deazaguanine synthase [Burkholderiaceae bacterium]
MFCRFAGCNLWSGREADRADGGLPFLRHRVRRHRWSGRWQVRHAARARRAHRAAVAGNDRPGRPLVVCTGGEPLLQLDEPLIDALHALGFEVAVETNGTQQAPAGLDWICVSPKAGAELVLTHGHELKLVFPQPGAMPEHFEGLDFGLFFLQPMDGLEQRRNTRLAVDYCLVHPQWRLSVQTHKILGIP